MAKSSNLQTLEEELKGLLNNEIDPELIAFGQALAESMQKLPMERHYRIEVELEGPQGVRLFIGRPGLEYELMLIHDGRWVLMGTPQIVNYD